MKIRFLPAFIALNSVAVVALLAQSQPAPATQPATPGGGPGGQRGPGGPGGAGRPKELDTELNKIMHTIEDDMRALRNPIKDMTKNSESLKTVMEIRAAFVSASKEKPDFLNAQPAEKKASFMADYDSQMKKVIATVDQLIAALKAGNSDDIQKYYKAVADFEDPSHKEFQAPKAPRGGMRGGPGGPGGPGGQPPAPQGAPAAPAPAAK